jgi:hypothetical protein
MRIFFFVIVVFLSSNVLGQNSLRSKIKNNWKKTDITAIDGSAYYDEAILGLDFDLNIFSNDSHLLVTGYLQTVSWHFRD